MAKIDLTNAVIGVAVGGIDQFLEERDAAAVPARTIESQKWTFWFRAGAVALGYLGELMNQQSRYAVPLAQSTVPLLTKSIYRMVTKSTTPAAVVSRPRTLGMTHNPGTRIERSYQPEFEQAVAF